MWCFGRCIGFLLDRTRNTVEEILVQGSIFYYKCFPILITIFPSNIYPYTVLIVPIDVTCRVMTAKRVAGSLLTYCIHVPVSSVHSRGGNIEFTISSIWDIFTWPSCPFFPLPPRPPLTLPGPFFWLLVSEEGSRPAKIGGSYLTSVWGTCRGNCILSDNLPMSGSIFAQGQRCGM